MYILFKDLEEKKGNEEGKEEKNIHIYKKNIKILNQHQHDVLANIITYNFKTFYVACTNYTNLQEPLYNKIYKLKHNPFITKKFKSYDFTTLKI